MPLVNFNKYYGYIMNLLFILCFKGDQYGVVNKKQWTKLNIGVVP